MGFAVLLAVVFVLISKFIGPKNPNPTKLSTYESGMEPVGTARTRFSVKYYMAAMMFIIFDIEIVFMYPWAVAFRKFTGYNLTYALIEMIVFIFILIIGYIYMLRKGALKWD
jgi:NADH-quinone oxidoreductase subunit A